MATPKNIPQTLDDLSLPPEVIPAAPAASTVHLKEGYCGEQVKIILAAGEGEAGKEAAFVRVNEDTWLVPRGKPVVVPLEAYKVLAETMPPQAADAPEGLYSPRHSVSVLERIAPPALKQAA